MDVALSCGLSGFLPWTYNVGMAHELKYKMNEFILNFPETLGLQRLSRLEARVFYVSPRSLMLQGFQNFFFKLMFLSLHQPQASLGSAVTGPRVCSGLVSALGLESASANS